MKMETTENVVRGKRNLTKWLSQFWHRQPHTYRAARDEKIVMWVGGQKIELGVEDWLRGH